MLGRCIVCYGGVLYVRAVYCMLGRCTVCYGGVLYARAVYCMLGWCTVCYGSVQSTDCVCYFLCDPDRPTPVAPESSRR